MTKKQTNKKKKLNPLEEATFSTQPKRKITFILSMTKTIIIRISLIFSY